MCPFVKQLQVGSSPTMEESKCLLCSNKWKNKQAHKQTCKWASKQTNKQTNKSANKHMSKQTLEQANKQKPTNDICNPTKKKRTTKQNMYNQHSVQYISIADQLVFRFNNWAHKRAETLGYLGYPLCQGTGAKKVACFERQKKLRQWYIPMGSMGLVYLPLFTYMNGLNLWFKCR